MFLSLFTDKSDLYKHLNLHKEYKKWNEKYKNYKKIKVEPIIDADTMLLVKYFVTSNVSHSSLENKYLLILLNKVVGTKSFDETILPEVYRKLKNKLKEKINNAEDICLITDIWTAKQIQTLLAW